MKQYASRGISCFNAETYSSAPFINFDQVGLKQVILQAIIDKYVCGEKSSDYDKDGDGIKAIEIMCDPEETPNWYIPQWGFEYAWSVTLCDWHQSNWHIVLVAIKEKVKTIFISHKKGTSIEDFFSWIIWSFGIEILLLFIFVC